jgi:hypothetical protein
MKPSTDDCEIVRDAGTLFGNIAQGWMRLGAQAGKSRQHRSSSVQWALPL